jgi:hypothetical protein
MNRFLIWGAFAVLVSAWCLWRPHAARVFVGLFFAAMGLGYHGTAILTNPNTYVDFAASAPISLYRDIGLALTEPNPRAFGIVMLVFETATSALILSRGRTVKLGLLAAIAFLLGIRPLGLEELPNAVLAVGLAGLLRHEYPADAVTMLRNRLRRPSSDRAARRANTPTRSGAGS